MEDTCAMCNSFLYWTVTPVWWNYIAHIFLCLFIFPKSNHSSPYDDDVAPDFLGHPPTGLSQPFGVYVCCVCFCLHVCLKPKSACQKGPLTTPPVADINPKLSLRAKWVSG